MEITKDTKMAEVEILKPYVKYLMYKCIMEDKPAVELSFQEMHELQPTWNVKSMIRGIEHLCEEASKRQLLYPVYTAEECKEDPEKADVHLLYLPGKKKEQELPFVLLMAGGAYTCVCSAVEALPTAACLNELGHDAFILNYRVMQDPLFPKPFEDIAAAVKFILFNKNKFGIQKESYILNGFSAGANAASVWGTEKNGWAKYKAPRPAALWLAYPFISSEYIDKERRNWLLPFMFGKKMDMAEVKA